VAEVFPELTGLFLAPLSQGNVGSTRVLSRDRPGGLAVANEVNSRKGDGGGPSVRPRRSSGLSWRVTRFGRLPAHAGETSPTG
jgi:hypothetical protein